MGYDWRSRKDSNGVHHRNYPGYFHGMYIFIRGMQRYPTGCHGIPGVFTGTRGIPRAKANTPWNTVCPRGTSNGFPWGAPRPPMGHYGIPWVSIRILLCNPAKNRKCASPPVLGGISAVWDQGIGWALRQMIGTREPGRCEACCGYRRRPCRGVCAEACSGSRHGMPWGSA